MIYRGQCEGVSCSSAERECGSTFTGSEGTVCTRLIVDAGFSEARGVVALVPGLDEGLGVLWNGQVQAMHAGFVMLVVIAARILACSLGFIYRSIQVPKIERR